MDAGEHIMKRISLLILSLLFLMLISSCTRSGSLRVTDAWARPGVAGQNGAIYFIVDNGLDTDDTLLGAKSDAAMMVEVHMSQMNADGTMTMTQQESVPIPAGEKVEFKPGGLHIMLMNLTNDLEKGDKVQFVLQFEKAGEMLVEATVKEQ
jgi:hypothetical protein